MAAGQFSLLSERLVIKNGIVLMGGAALILMLVSRGSVDFLIVLYAINVFLTFCLSQAGMVRHWWNERGAVSAWKRKFLINGIGLLLTGFILISQVVLKFQTGGWITILITGSLVLVSILIKRFYHQTGRRLARLDNLMATAAESDVRALASESRRGRKHRRLQSTTPRERRRSSSFPASTVRGCTPCSASAGFSGTRFRNWFFIQAGRH